MPGTDTITGYLALGSNRGDRAERLAAAVDALEAAGVRVAGSSSVWRTRPVGAAGPGEFLNRVVRVETDHAPRGLLRACLAIERTLGRTGERSGARTIDIDVLWLDGVTVDEPDLVVPHPRMWDRAFVLAPLAELAPDLRDPRSGASVSERLRAVGTRDVARAATATAGAPA